MTRFPLVSGPIKFPHHDLILNDTRQDNPVFDLGIDLDSYDGSVYLQIDHVQEMARSIGMLSKEQSDALIEENQRLKAQLNALPEKAQELTDGMARLVDNFRADLSNFGSGASSVEDNSNSETDESESESNDPSPIDKLLADANAGVITIEQGYERSGIKRPASVRKSGDNSADTVFGV